MIIFKYGSVLGPSMAKSTCGGGLVLGATAYRWQFSVWAWLRRSYAYGKDVRGQRHRVLNQALALISEVTNVVL